METWGEIGPRGAVEFKDEDRPGRRWLWARCHVEGCPNMVCRRLSSRFCWPHAGLSAADLIPKAAKAAADG